MSEERPYLQIPVPSEQERLFHEWAEKNQEEEQEEEERVIVINV